MAQRKTSKKSRKTTKKRTQKGKVYIAPYKIIILCASIITICMGLLLVTTISSQHGVSDDLHIVKRFEESKKEKASEKVNQKAKSAKTTESEKPKELAKATKPEKTPQAEKTTKPVQSKESAKPAKTEKAAKPTEPAKSEKPVKSSQPSPAPQKKDNTEIIRTPEPAQKIPHSAGNQSESPVSVSADNKENDKKAAPVQTEKTAPAEKDFGFPAAKNNAQLVFLFDDGGQNLNHLEKFLQLPFPITIAVLPKLAHSKESAAKIRQSAGKELMLHQPMQAVNENVNPGPGAITPQMSDSEICSTLFQNISEIGPIAGLNNHEGSKITADASKMEVILKYASESGVFFLDSRTNADSKVPYVSKELGLTYYERNGRFLDNEKTRANALKEIKNNLDIANRDGVVIMIGHIWSADFLPDVLMEVYPELVKKGYTFKTVSACRGLKR